MRKEELKKKVHLLFKQVTDRNKDIFLCLSLAIGLLLIGIICYCVLQGGPEITISQKP